LLRQLRPKLQLDLDAEGLIRDDRASGSVGRTRDPGVCFIPPRSQLGDLAGVTAWASAVVLALTTLLDRHELDHPVYVSEVDEDVCGGCGTCVKTCAFAASGIDVALGLSTIDARRCKGCGNCVVACPTGARDLITFPESHIIAAIGILSKVAPVPDEPHVLALLCNGCGYPAADVAGELASSTEASGYSANVMPLRVECGGNVDTQYVLEAFKDGFDGVAVSVCRDGHCHHVVGNTDMDRRLGLFREVLRSRHIDAERLRVIHVAPHEGQVFTEEIQGFCRDLQARHSPVSA
jgi:coenzyme F420-reducing hydrogenase delta subunit/NAD-dependent dihydropyrimidine dehydrogenase PreA subunit